MWRWPLAMKWRSFRRLLGVEMSLEDRIAVQHEDFDLGAEYARLAADDGAGAVVSFVGKVRAANEGSEVTGLCLEHYPGMTDAALQALVAEARSRWPLRGCTLIHRIGALACGAQIVLVVVSSGHRQAAFEAASYLMDQLKTRVPLWKKEQLADGRQRWLDARHSDQQAADRW